jgi:hypothetical protein
MSTKTREQRREVVLALLWTGDARALLAAALIVVTLTLTVHTKARALEEAGRAVLYVGAPSVSVSSAREAGVISRSYAETTSPETLLALGFSGKSASRYVVDRALASVTEQPADPDETITAQAALEAGAVYLAQTGTRPPGETGPNSKGELASASPVRPELGDGTVAPAEDLPADDTSTKDLAGASDAGGDLAQASGPPDSPVTAYPGASEDDPAALYPASGGEGPLELVSSFPTDTGAGEDFPEGEPPAEFETGPISAEEQVPTTLAGRQMEIPSSQYEPANEPADNGEEELAVVPEESPPEQDATNAPIGATAPHPFPNRESSTTPSVEEPDGEQSPAILLPAEPTADEEASPEASTPYSGDEAPGEATVGVSISQEQTAEEGFEDDACEQVATIVVGGEPGQDVTVADGEVQNETPRRSPEPARDGETPRPDTARPTDTTEAPPEIKPEGETPPAEDASDEGAPGKNGPPDRQDDRASPERPAGGPEANDPRSANPQAEAPQGNSRGGSVTPPPGGRRGDPARVPAGAEDGPEDREPVHGGREANGRTPRDDADRHPRRPADASERMSRRPHVLSDGAGRPAETPAEDGTRRTAREREISREDVVEQARPERARHERLATRRAVRETAATFEPTRTELEDRGRGRRAPLAAGPRGQGPANDEGAPDALDVPNREEHLD